MGAAAATMPGMEIKALTVDEFRSRPEWPALIREYAVESALEPFADTATPQWDAYQALLDQGALVVLGAFDADRLIGFLAVVVTVLPHFGVRMACTESYFVASAARNTGAGLALLREAQAVAQAAEAQEAAAEAQEAAAMAQEEAADLALAAEDTLASAEEARAQAQTREAEARAARKSAQNKHGA